MSQLHIVDRMVRLWPREVLFIKGPKGQNVHPDILDALKGPGVYILYQKDTPYYIGEAKNNVWDRIWSHAKQPNKRYYNFWDYFSAFFVNDPDNISELESVLIHSMPTVVNSSKMEFKQVRISSKVSELMRRRIYQDVNTG